MIKSTRSGWRSVLALEAVLVMVAMTGANVAATEPYRGTPGDVDDPRVALRNAVVKQLEPLQAQLRSDFATSFGGLWVDDEGTTTIAVVDRQRAIQEAVDRAKLLGPVNYLSVRYSEAQLRQAKLRIRELIDYRDFSLDGQQLISVAEDTMANRVLVSLVGSPKEAAPDLVRSTIGDVVEFEYGDAEAVPVACTRSNCAPPLKAGIKLFDGASVWCNASFIFRSTTTPYQYYISGAGHCRGNEPLYSFTVDHPVGTYAGTLWYETSGPSAGTDALLLAIAPANASNFKLTTGGYNSVTSRETISGAVLGSGVCSFKPSGYDCGSLAKKGVDTCCAQDQFAATGQTYAVGDSGSPVWYGGKAQGIVSAANCNVAGTWDCYSPIQSAEVWKNHLRVLTTAP